ncbi:MAG: NADH-quinone oxidoreductase subunit NuoF [Defluviitaleaceae bacterium]|nr:NADH-quinone oxidoreductase subunit NuoF [Defluviitaleaceae bacterium]
MYRSHILVCAGTNCHSGKSDKFIEYLDEKLLEHKLNEEVKVVKTGCFGLCAFGPVVVVYPEGIFYQMVDQAGIERIFAEHVLKGRIVDDLVYEESKKHGVIEPFEQTDFFRKQVRVALHNCGVIDPEDINEYIAVDGYQALAKVLTTMTPQQVIDEIKASGLRGRGGAGFPTGLKWSFAAAEPAGKKYICCNADEGDPGAFMDRSVLEGDPHVLIEAMAIAAYAVGADEGYKYVRAEYPLAVQRFQKALDDARAMGFLGENILGTGFSFDMHVKLGAGAFVCGEETALLTSIEGNRGEPRPRPPFPAVKGLFGKPTVLNNVETLANIPRIIMEGADWFAGMGTETSKGTKVFALGGNIVNVGLVEVPMGITLREIVEEIGGGIPSGKKFKAAQTGGPSGGCIPAKLLDTGIDYESLAQVGSMMGSGGLIVMDEDSCMVDIAKFYLDFTVDESCGKCAPCRIGTKQLLEILEKITQGQGVMEDLDTLKTLSTHIMENSLCALGQTAPNPVASTLEYFWDEYVEHVVNKKCPAGMCKDLLTYTILPDKCIGCTICARVCPVNAISGKVKEIHTIDEKCIKCGVCVDKCKFDAIIKV